MANVLANPAAAGLAAQLNAGLWLNATAKRAWVSRTPADLPSASSPSEATIRSLFDGAIAAALRLFATPQQRAKTPPLSPIRWIYRLVGYYHLTHSTTALLERAAARFADQGRPALADWAQTRAREEDNHDLLALRDLQAMDVDPTQAIAALSPHPAERLVAWFRAAVHAPDPIACVGYAYTVERLAMQVTASDIATIDAMLATGVRATRCMRVHSGIGKDADHVLETIELAAKLPASQREAIARAIFESACVCTTPPQSGYPEDATLAAQLAPAYELQP